MPVQWQEGLEKNPNIKHCSDIFLMESQSKQAFLFVALKLSQASCCTLSKDKENVISVMAVLCVYVHLSHFSFMCMIVDTLHGSGSCGSIQTHCRLTIAFPHFSFLWCFHVG